MSAKLLNRIKLSRSSETIVVIICIVLFYSILFFGIHNGAGQFWDWSFPYFKNHITNFFDKSSSSWTSNAMGSPLSYSTDYFFKYVVSRFHFFQPETVLYGLIIAIFSTGTYGVYLISRKFNGIVLSFLLSLIAFLNPTIFYNYTAGYLAYLFGYTSFIYMIYFLFYKYDSNNKSAIILGFLFVLGGSAIQLFFMEALLIFIFFVVNKSKFRLKYAFVCLITIFSLSLVWLSNFFFHAINIEDTSKMAIRGQFQGLLQAPLNDIFSFHFSKATLITKYYSNIDLIPYTLLFIALIYLYAKKRFTSNSDLVLLIFTVLMAALCTGFFQVLNLGPINTLYPMFREVGHFAPILVLSVILSLTIKFNQFDRAIKYFVFMILIIGIAITGSKYIYYPQTVNYAEMRKKFLPFEILANKNTSEMYDKRILSYPFYGQYSINSSSSNNLGLPLKDSGHDSYSAYSNVDYLKNEVNPLFFQDSPQYQFSISHDIELLRPYGVKYIYDYSKIYESNYDKYVPRPTFNNDLSLIKNNKHFFKDILRVNPTAVSKVSESVLEIKQPSQKISAKNAIFTGVDKIPNESYLNISKYFDPRGLDYTTSSNFSRNNYFIEPLFDNTKQSTIFDRTNQLITRHVATDHTKNSNLYLNTNKVDLYYRFVNQKLEIYQRDTYDLQVNNEQLNLLRSNPEKTIYSVILPRQIKYFIYTNRSTIPVEETNEQYIGLLSNGESVKVLKQFGDNLVENASFESGLWETNVGDCSRYDNDADIKMSLDTEYKTDGQNSLLLAAKNHNACTSTKLNLIGNSKFLLSYDYRGENSPTASTYIKINNNEQDSIKNLQGISDRNWHNAFQVFETPSKISKSRLFAYAAESASSDYAINQYDHFSIYEIEELFSYEIPRSDQLKSIYTLKKSSDLSFKFKSNTEITNNLIQNGSFEQGPWQRKVSDCFAYDRSPNLSMQINGNKPFHGKQYLTLTAKKHYACTSRTVRIQPSSDYNLTFSSKGIVGQKFGYAISINGTQKNSQNYQKTFDSNNWQTTSKNFHSPSNAQTVSIYLYAFESDKSVENRVNYDDVSLHEMPSSQDRFYIVDQGTPLKSLEPSSSLTASSNTQYSVTVDKVEKPFFLSLSESYNPSWKLRYEDGISSKFAWTRLITLNSASDLETHHFKVNNYNNAWYIDPSIICKRHNKKCHKNTDGSYKINLIAEFVPQRYFILSSFISFTAFIVCIVLLLSGNNIANKLVSSKKKITYKWKK